MLSVEQVCQELVGLFQVAFGGKYSGRYNIQRGRLQWLWGKEVVYDSDIQEIQENMLQKGYCVINLGHFIAVLEKKVIEGYRNVPKGMIVDQD